MPGFSKPTTTQTPDALLDYWLIRLTGAELRVMLYAIRRTYGFGREEDAIALDQFLHGITRDDGRVLDEGIGISRRALLYAIKSLCEKGVLLKERQSDDAGRDTSSTYRLSIIDERHPHPGAARGLREVNTTQVPDEIFDHWLPHLSDAELKVLLYIVRRTLGFRKAADAIKPDQFRAGIQTAAGMRLDDGCGLSEKHLYRAISGLKEKGLITVERRVSPRVGHLPSVYTLVFENDAPALLRLAGDPDPRTRDYRDADDGQRAPTLPRQQEGVVSQGQAAGPAPRSGREGNTVQKGYASKVAPQQTDLLRKRQQTEIQQTECIDIESSHTGNDEQRNPMRETEDESADTQSIEQSIRTLVEEFGDAASPRASVTKAVRRWQASGLTATAFLALTSEVAELVRAYQPAKPMAYFFRALENLMRVQAEHERYAPPAHPIDEPPLIDEADAAWRAVLEELRETLTAANYTMWLAGTRVIARHGDVRQVAVPTLFHKQWLDTKLAQRIQKSLDLCGFGHIQIDIVVAEVALRDVTESERPAR